MILVKKFPPTKGNEKMKNVNRKKNVDIQIGLQHPFSKNKRWVFILNTVTVLIIRGDLCSRISRFKKKREIK